MEAGQAYRSPIGRHILPVLSRPKQHRERENHELNYRRRPDDANGHDELPVHDQFDDLSRRVRPLRSPVQHPAEETKAFSLDRLSHVLLGSPDHGAWRRP